MTQKGKGIILIVDDTLEFLTILTDILSADGYQVKAVDSGKRALAFVDIMPPDLILLDIQMPDMDGLEVIRRLKSRHESSNIPIVLLSGKSLQVQGLNLGAVDYIVKPFQREELLARIHTHVELRRMREGFKQQAADLRLANEQLQQEIDEHTKTGEMLKESEKKLSILINNFQGMVYSCLNDPNRTMTFVSEGAMDLTGYLPHELKNNAVITYNDLIHPEDRQYIRDTVNDLLHIGAPYTLEYRIADKSGTEKWVWERGRGIGIGLSSPSGEMGHLEGFITDITERRAIESRLCEVQRMESIGRLAGGVAHDFNNMLGVILANSELVMEEVNPAEFIYDCIHDVRKAAERSATLTRQLLAFARKQPISPRVINLNETIENIIKMLRRLIREDIRLDLRKGEGVWPVKMDPVQLDQILTNLCINALDAIKGSGKIVIETKNDTFNEDCCAHHPGVSPGEFVLMAVSDTGSGMDQETLGNLFEPFFTTKEKGKGTGMGLATVYGIVKQNNGFIDVISRPGSGATFQIYLPRHTVSVPETPIHVAEAAVKRGQETILMVEDEVMFLDVVKRRLEKIGYTVLAAAGPEEAIRLAKDHAGKVDLLITDVVMPEMNGRELAHLLLSLYPKLKYLFMSGYTADILSRDGVLEEGVCFIEKPFSINDLVALMRKALGV